MLLMEQDQEEEDGQWMRRSYHVTVTVKYRELRSYCLTSPVLTLL